MRSKINGFTLVELLGVIVILAMLALIAYPVISGQIKRTTDKMSAATVTLIESGTRSYINDHKNSYPKVNNAEYCITLETLAKENYIRKSIIDAKTKQELDLSQVVIATYKNGKFNFEIKSAC